MCVCVLVEVRKQFCRRLRRRGRRWVRVASFSSIHITITFGCCFRKEEIDHKCIDLSVAHRVFYGFRISFQFVGSSRCDRKVHKPKEDEKGGNGGGKRERKEKKIENECIDL